MRTDNSAWLAERHVGTRAEFVGPRIAAKIAFEAAKRGLFPEAIDDLVRVALGSNFLLGCGPGGVDDFDPKSFLDWAAGQDDLAHLSARAPDAPPPEPKVKILTSEQIDKLSPIQKLNYENRLAEDRQTTLRDNHKESQKRLADINSAYPS